MDVFDVDEMVWQFSSCLVQMGEMLISGWNDQVGTSDLTVN